MVYVKMQSEYFLFQDTSFLITGEFSFGFVVATGCGVYCLNSKQGATVAQWQRIGLQIYKSSQRNCTWGMIPTIVISLAQVVPGPVKPHSAEPWSKTLFIFIPFAKTLDLEASVVTILG